MHNWSQRPLSFFRPLLLHFSSFCLFAGHFSASAGLFKGRSLLVNWAHCPGMVIQHFDGLWKSAGDGRFGGGGSSLSGNVGGI